MSKVMTFFATLMMCVSAFANTHVVLVTPRGETIMEQIFKEELVRLLPDRKFRFTLIKPNVNNPSDMSRLP